jgi:tetratricopeptide (TPR) repeat protein
MSTTADRIDVAAGLHESALSLQQAGRLHEAGRACRESLRRFEQECGPDHPDVANVLVALASILDEQGSAPAEAEQCALRAVAIIERVAPEMDPWDAAMIRIQARMAAGTICRNGARYRDAEQHLTSALRDSEETFGARGEQTVDARNNLAVLYKYTGEFDKAAALYGDALDAAVEIYGDSSDAVATICHNLGGLAHARGQFAEGEPWARKAYLIRRSLHGEDHPMTAADGAALAGVLDGLERYDESEPLYCKALEVFERLHGPEHYEIAVNLNNLAALKAARGDAAGAEADYRRALAIKEKLFDAQHPEIATTSYNLAMLLAEQGCVTEAQELASRAAVIFQQALGVSHPNTIQCLRGLFGIAGTAA